MSHPTYKTVDVDGVEIFYREAGDTSKPTLLLLHGFPTSSHMFRDLIPLLSEQFHLVAPDFPGFGRSAMPSRSEFTYKFENIANIIARFTEVVGLKKFAMYIFDYGAPVGLRVALHHPDRVTAIISQNGNAYEEGLSTAWSAIEKAWREPTDANREGLRALLSPESIRWQYEHGVTDTKLVSPDGSTLDAAYMARPDAQEVQLDLIMDYGSNVALYPSFQAYFRSQQPKLLAIWGKNDPFFVPPGAEAYKRDLPHAEVRFLETGHFALETHAEEIAQAISGFLKS